MKIFFFATAVVTLSAMGLYKDASHMSTEPEIALPSVAVNMASNE